MVSRHIYLQLVIRILFVVLTSLGTAYCFFSKQYFFSGLLLLVLVFQTVSLITYVNQTNRKIAYFFDAIKNEDFTLRFPEKLSVKSLEELNHSLNMLNAMIQEIHLKKQAQEQYYQEIIKHASIGIFTYNKKGHILFANAKIEELLNYTPLNHIKQLNQVDKKLYELFAKLKPFDRKLMQLSNEREKKQIALKSTGITVDDEELLLVVGQDIHQELDEKETDSWVRLIRVLTHEIMNTITPITSISDSILSYFKTNKGLVPLEEFNSSHIKNTVKGLEVIKEQGMDLMDFVQSYRSFLSLPKPDKELVKAQKLLDKIKVLMDQEKNRDHISFETVSNPADLELFIDEKQISQILINLSKNALQSLSGQENGAIRITASQDEQGKKFIEVRDNGPGIPEDLIDEIFVPFFTTKNTGTGIGLSLSKQIMHLHGGSIQVTSNKNTVFTLNF
ncbi:MAG: PAS domain-containing sensor histidine kinase [Flavobacteriaceae bacterium]